jgi:two-component system KDP operon response regulator KdpE
MSTPKSGEGDADGRRVPPLILVVDDEAAIRRFLRANLDAVGYRVDEATSAAEALRRAAMQPPDLVLLDLGLPDVDGLEVVRRLREWLAAPIIVVSARGRESDKVAALDLGADDYLTKPFGVGELGARIRAALRHSLRSDRGIDPVFRCTAGDRRLVVDLAARTVRIADGEGAWTDLRCTPTEFKLLALLVRHAGKVLTHQHLLREVWGPSHAGDVQYLRVYAGQLRRKLERDPAQPAFLVTEPGIGYRFVEADRA